MNVVYRICHDVSLFMQYTEMCPGLEEWLYGGFKSPKLWSGILISMLKLCLEFLALSTLYFVYSG